MPVHYEAVTMKRRAFFAATVSLAAVQALGEESRALEKKSEAVLRLSCQEWLIPGKKDAKTAPSKLEVLSGKVDKLSRWGFEGIEISGADLLKNRDVYKKVLKGTGISVSAVSGGYEGALGHHDPAVRRKAAASLITLVRAAGELGANGVIFVPAYLRDKSRLSAWEVRTVLLQIVPEIAEEAKKAGTTLILEPVNRKETLYVRLLADAAAIARDVAHPGFTMMGDFYHMGIEETSDLGAFLSAGSHLRHVRVATTANRLLPGQEERNFINGFCGLKLIGYHGFCSLKCEVRGDGAVEIPKSAAFLRKQWEQA